MQPTASTSIKQQMQYHHRRCMSRIPVLCPDASVASLWFRNSGSEHQRLTCCEFAGWDSAQQFCLGPAAGPAEDRTDGADEEPVRRLEMNLEMTPGERASVTVSCQARRELDSLIYVLCVFQSGASHCVCLHVGLQQTSILIID